MTLTLLQNDGINLKVALFIPSIERGGVERNLVIVANYLAIAGHSVYILCLRISPEIQAKLDKNIRIVRIGLRKIRHGLLQSRVLDGIFVLPGTISFLFKNNDVVVLSFQSNLVAILASKISNTPVIVRISNHPSVVKFERNISRKIAEWLKPIIYRFSTAVITNSISCQKIFLPLPCPVYMIYNPISINDIKRLSQESVNHPWITEKKIVITSVGRLSHQKGFDTLIKAFAIIRNSIDAKLIIIGDGGELDKLTKLCNSLEISEHVDFIGHQKNVHKFVARSNLFVLASRYEGLPNALLEAAALGIKIVSTNCESGPKEIIKHASQGELVPIDDPRAMANAIVRQLNNSAPVDTEKALNKFLQQNILDLYVSVITHTR